MNLRMMGVKSGTELAEVMAAVGLAQNFAALRALATDGIQTGHMTLHARSVVKAAVAPANLFDETLERLVRSGEIKVGKAEQILGDIQSDGFLTISTVAVGHVQLLFQPVHSPTRRVSAPDAV